MNNPSKIAQRPHPAWIRWLLWALLVLLGPGLLAFVGTEIVRRSNFAERATAEVIEVRRSTGGSRVLYCPVYAWDHGGERVQTEGPCDSDDVPVGHHVAIRYPADDLGSARTDSFGSMYGELTPVIIPSILFTGLLIVLVVRRIRG